MSDSHEALQERIMELEIKASYTEDLLEQLNMTIYRQQQQIDALIGEVRELKRQAPADGSGGPRAKRAERGTSDCPGGSGLKRAVPDIKVGAGGQIDTGSGASRLPISVSTT